MMAENEQLIAMAEAERTEMAELLSTLTAEQWESESLCEGWSIKDVVAHMISYDDLGKLGLVKRLVRGRFSRANEIGVEQARHLNDQEVLERFRSHLRPHGLTAAFGGLIGLVDGTMHHQDIRRPLDMPRTIPTDRLLKVLESLPTNPRLGAKKLIHGLRLRATDVDWVYGQKGPEVVGTGEALMMAMGGRRSAAMELQGQGSAVLMNRMP